MTSGTTSQSSATATRRDLILVRHFLVFWFAMTAIGVIGTVAVGGSSTSHGHTTRTLADTVIASIVFILLVLFPLIGSTSGSYRLASRQSSGRLHDVEFYFTCAVGMLLFAMPISLVTAFRNGTLVVALFIVVPVLANLIVAHTAVRLIRKGLQIADAAAHYILLGSVLSVLVFALVATSYFGWLPPALTETTNAVILAASLLLVPEAWYVVIVIAAARQTSGAVQPPPQRRSTRTELEVDLTVKTGGTVLRRARRYRISGKAEATTHDT